MVLLNRSASEDTPFFSHSLDPKSLQWEQYDGWRTDRRSAFYKYCMYAMQWLDPMEMGIEKLTASPIKHIPQDLPI
jgi:hypothetical protein